MKLTKPQSDLLARVAERATGYPCDGGYRPALRLIEIGLCDGKTSTFGGFRLVLTSAGRAELDRRSKETT